MNPFDTIAKFFKRKSIASTESVNAPASGDLARLLGLALREQGYEAEEAGGCQRLPSGIQIQAELLEAVARAPGSIRTSTRTVATHDQFFPQGLPEFQHAMGDDVERAISEGFSSWAKMDLVTLEDAIRTQPEICTFIDMEFPSPSDSKASTRRVVLGPPGHYVSSSDEPPDEEHPFCPCCLITRNLEAFRSILQSDETVGIRLFASRSADGQLAADCRVNGEDFPEGVKHLMDYIRTWPDRPGLEFRKQYVVVRSVEVATQ